jgi:DNA polymerase elongation subunit (family B)
MSQYTRPKFASLNSSYKKVNSDILKKEPLYFMPHYCEDIHYQEQEYKPANYKILLSGAVEDGRKLYVMLNGIFPYFEILINGEQYISNPNNIFQQCESANKTECKSKCGTDNILPHRIGANIQLIESEENAIYNIMQEIQTKKIILYNKEHGSSIYEYELIKARPFRGFQEKESIFLRLYFRKLQDRKIAIKIADELKLQLAHDDATNYINVVCRDKMTSFSSWAKLSNYSRIKSPRFKCDIISINTDGHMHVEDNYKTLLEIPHNLQRDRSMSVCWDIETYTPDNDGHVPQPEYPNDRIFCIGLCFQWIHDPAPFLCICLIDSPTEEKKEYETIYCKSEKDMLLKFADIVSSMDPDYIQAFNDGQYDWPWVIKRVEKHGIMDQFLSKFEFANPWFDKNNGTHRKKHYSIDNSKAFPHHNIKISADASAEVFNMTAGSIIPLDLRVIFRQLHGNPQESSLKYFLAQNNLSSKEDMPITRLFSICKKMDEFRAEIANVQSVENHRDLEPTEFEKYIPAERMQEYTQLRADMTEVAYYCVIDVVRCHDLMVKRSVHMERREVAKVSFCTIFAAHYRGNGMKVRNITIAYGQQHPFNIRFANRSNNKISDDEMNQKYAGGYVFNPIKGLKTSKLSILERIEKCKYYKSNPGRADMALNIGKYAHFAKWEDETPENIQFYYTLIKKYGAVVDPLRLNEIEKTEGVALPRHFTDFWTEHTGRPIAGFDFSSLYPSIIRTYNFSPEKCIIRDTIKQTKTLARHMLSQEVELHPVSFNFCGIERRAYFIAHDNKFDDKATDFNFGVYPYILDMLFNKRDRIKKQMKEFGFLVEEINKLMSCISRTDNKSAYFDLTAHFSSQHYEKLKISDILGSEDVTKIKESDQKEAQLAEPHKLLSILEEMRANYEFQQKALECTQLSIKVMMNTFYGESGNKRSPFYILELAYAITSYGQENIKRAHEWVVELGCKMYYGDTDSLYISMPEPIFEEIDRKYYSGELTKLDYWTALVDLSFKEGPKIIGIVNERFKKDNGTAFLKMAYEEFLFPLFLASKKKYTGVMHEKHINFFPKDLFVRGLVIKQKGVPQFVKDLIDGALKKAFHPDNILEVAEICLDVIDSVYNNRTLYDPHMFAASITYKPYKDNKRVNQFAEYAESIGRKLVANERFTYAVAKMYPFKYDHRGRKQELKVGEKMRFLEEFLEDRFTIDLDYYMDRNINGQLGRLICYMPQFTNADEKKTLDAARKTIKKYSMRYSEVYSNMGPLYQRAFKVAHKALLTNENYAKYVELFNIGDSADEIDTDSIRQGYFGENRANIIGGNDPDKVITLNTTSIEERCNTTRVTSYRIGKIEKKAIAAAKKFAKKYVADYMETHKRERKKALNKICRVYYTKPRFEPGEAPSQNKIEEAHAKFLHDFAALHNKFSEWWTHIEQIYNKYTSVFRSIMQDVCKSIDVSEEYKKEIRADTEEERIKKIEETEKTIKNIELDGTKIKGLLDKRIDELVGCYMSPHINQINLFKTEIYNMFYSFHKRLYIVYEIDKRRPSITMPVSRLERPKENILINCDHLLSEPM